MSDGFSTDFSEIDQLAADLGVVADNAGPFVRGAVIRTSINIKKDWRDNTKGLVHAPAFPYSIGFDVASAQLFGQTVIKSEIGPDKEKPQGALGNLLEFGSMNNSPRGDGHAALERNQADFVHGLDEALKDAERKAGL